MTSLSTHLIESYNASQRATRGPFGVPMANTTNPSECVMAGNNSFYNPMVHGNVTAGGSSGYGNMSVLSPMDSQEPSLETAKKIATLQAKLNQRLGPEYISTRPGGAGAKLTYVEGWKVINLANDVFGFNGWSSSICSLVTDFVDYNTETQRYNIGVTAIIRVTLRDGTFHEDVGYGVLENSKQKGPALDKCKKEAVTDGVKRALRNFGNVLGNCLYDKAYVTEINKFKVPPPKFDRSTLHRRPEFDESTSTVASPSVAGPSRPPDPVPPQKTPAVTPAANPSPAVAPRFYPKPPIVSTPAQTEVAPSKPQAPSRNTPHGLQTPKDTPIQPLAAPTDHISNPLPPPRFAVQQRPSLPPAPIADQTKGKGKEEPRPPAANEPADTSTSYFGSDDDAMFAELDIEERILDGLDDLENNGEQALDDESVLYEDPEVSPANVDDSYIPNRGVAGLPTRTPETGNLPIRQTVQPKPPQPSPPTNDPGPVPAELPHRSAAPRAATVAAPSAALSRSALGRPSASALSASKRKEAIQQAIMQEQVEAGKMAAENKSMPPPQPATKPIAPSTSSILKPANLVGSSTPAGAPPSRAQLIRRAPTNVNQTRGASPNSGGGLQHAQSRPSTSIGGFHFPPGVNPDELSQSRRPNPFASSTSGVGAKRGPDGLIRRVPAVGPGMGLSAGGVGGGYGGEEDTSGPVDHKRMKR